jgi:hypothetical protein
MTTIVPCIPGSDPRQCPNFFSSTCSCFQSEYQEFDLETEEGKHQDWFRRYQMTALDVLRHMNDPPFGSGFAHVSRRTRYLSYPIDSPAIDFVGPKRPLVAGDYIPSYPERIHLRARRTSIPTRAQLQAIPNPLAIGVAVLCMEMDEPTPGTTIDPAVIDSVLSRMIE